MSDYITFYNYEYEAKLLSCIVTDKPFFVQIADILSPNYFASDATKFVIGYCLRHLREYSETPSYLTLAVEIEGLRHKAPTTATEALKFCLDAKGFTIEKDLEYVKKTAIDFCRNQEIKRAIYDSVDLLNVSDFEGIKSRLDSALKVGTSRELGHDYIKDFEQRYSEESRETIATPWKPINNITGNGIGSGEMGIIIAPGGAGKSWILCALGAHALLQGKTVIHYTLELNKVYTALRYDSVITGVSNSSLKENKESIKDVLSKITGQLIVEDYPTKGASTLTLAAHLDRCLSMGIKPDMIIVDYADLLKGSNKELRLELREIYESLRKLAADYECCLWTASQSNRESAKSEIIEGDKVAEDYSKIATGDVIISLSRRTEDKINDQARFHIIKNRFGPDGITFPAKFSTINGYIELYENGDADFLNIINQSNMERIHDAITKLSQYDKQIDKLKNKKEE